MFKASTRRLIKSHKWVAHSNKSQFFNRINDVVQSAIDDMVLCAHRLDEAQLQQLFTKEKLEPLVEALMRPDLVKGHQKSKYTESQEENDRIFALGYMFLQWSLNITGSVIDNRWARELYSQHEAPLRNMLNMLYHERAGKKLSERKALTKH